MAEGILYVVYNKWIIDPLTKKTPYKIGITKNSVKDRYYGLGLKMPGEFETVFAYRIEDYDKAEQSINTIFNKYRVNGEWFKLGDDAFNMIRGICETMGGVLVTDEIEDEIEVETSAGSEPVMPMLRTVGMKTFVQYYGQFRDNPVAEIIHFMKLHENYVLNALRAKASTGKRIFTKKLEKRALEIITNAGKVDAKTKKDAEKLLDEINGGGTNSTHPQA